MGLEGTVLVTGAAGFIGQHLVMRLTADGVRVRAAVRRTTPVLVRGVEYVHADLTRLEDCQRAVAGVHAIVHCAASSSGAAVIVANPLVHVTPNTVMNAQLLDAAYQAGVERFVFLSSSVVYPEAGTRPMREEEALVDHPYAAYHGVGWMKRYTEVLCEWYARRLPGRKMPCLVVRPSNVYGPGDKFDFGTCHVTGALIRKVVERQQPIEVWGTGEDVRDLIYVDDFIEGLLAACTRRSDYLEVNLGAGCGVSVREILRTILAVDGYADAQVVLDPSKPRTIPARVLDIERARAELGFRPRTTLQEGLRRTLAWYRASLTASSARSPAPPLTIGA